MYKYIKIINKYDKFLASIPKFDIKKNTNLPFF